MIFPEIPKRHLWITYSPELVAEHTTQAKTPLQPVEQTKTVDIEQWFKDHGLPSTRVDPAALSKHSGGEPIDWWGRDAVEFYALCIMMVVWIVYWYGVHHGAW